MPQKKVAPKRTKQVRTKKVVTKAAPAAKKPQTKRTKIVVKCNCGFQNNLYIRGEGIRGLSWDKGMLMKCTKDDEWVWETKSDFRKGQVKILLNDALFEQGENHDIACGKSITFAPEF